MARSRAAIPDSDKGCWFDAEGKALIIRAEIIVPKAEETVTKYSVP